MINNLSIARRVTVLALTLVALHRLHLIFMVMGLHQVIDGLAHMDGITIAISVTLFLNLLVIPAALYGRKWGLFLGYLLLVNNMVFSGPFLLADLANPHHLTSWTGSMIVLAGNFLGLVYGLIAIIESFGRDFPAWAQEMQSRILKGTGAVTIAMFLLAAALPLGSTPATGLSETPDAVIQVELKDMSFQPDHLELPKGQRTALFLINRDDLPHSFDVDALNIHVTVPAQGSAIAFVQPMESGHFHLYCAVAGHERAGMAGRVTVQ